MIVIIIIITTVVRLMSPTTNVTLSLSSPPLPPSSDCHHCYCPCSHHCHLAINFTNFCDHHFHLLVQSNPIITDTVGTRKSVCIIQCVLIKRVKKNVWSGTKKLSIVTSVLIKWVSVKWGFNVTLFVAFTFQGEDEVMFMEYRKEMKILFDNIAQLAS